MSNVGKVVNTHRPNLFFCRICGRLMRGMREAMRQADAAVVFQTAAG